MRRPDLHDLAQRIDAPIVTRFAPSPTGYLHIGHVVNAIYAWGVARALGGRVILRIEDHDRIRSRREFEAAWLEDRDGHWTYQFAVTCDDERQEITLVIRGEDLLSSTGRQIRLARMLGRDQPPLFLHHPILVNAAGETLSKSSGDAGVRELRAAGSRPEDVIGRAAAAAGLIDGIAPIEAKAVRDLFD